MSRVSSLFAPTASSFALIITRTPTRLVGLGWNVLNARRPSVLCCSLHWSFNREGSKPQTHRCGVETKRRRKGWSILISTEAKSLVFGRISKVSRASKVSVIERLVRDIDEPFWGRGLLLRTINALSQYPQLPLRSFCFSVTLLALLVDFIGSDLASAEAARESPGRGQCDKVIVLFLTVCEEETDPAGSNG